MRAADGTLIPAPTPRRRLSAASTRSRDDRSAPPSSLDDQPTHVQEPLTIDARRHYDRRRKGGADSATGQPGAIESDDQGDWPSSMRCRGDAAAHGGGSDPADRSIQALGGLVLPGSDPRRHHAGPPPQPSERHRAPSSQCEFSTHSNLEHDEREHRMETSRRFRGRERFRQRAPGWGCARGQG